MAIAISATKIRTIFSGSGANFSIRASNSPPDLYSETM